jgi:2-polyprenyl-3-methyl-5-hydroxy-6-metoxy-1,4-benzoquinol methylase
MIVTCLCGNEADPLIQNGRQTSFIFQNQISRVHVCRSCTHVFFFPRPTDKQLAAYYNGKWNEASNYSIDFGYGAWIDNLESEIHKPKATFIESILRLRKERFGEASRVVVHDASCGYGPLVSKLNMLGFEATGSDIDGESIELAKKRGNNAVFQCHFSDIPDILPAGVNILTCYHSLEHYLNPLEFFRTAKRVLRPGGLLIMSVPSGAYLPARVDYFGKFDWCFYPGHLQYFTPRSAEVLMAIAGLRVIDAFSYDWDGTQEDWLLNTASRLPEFQSVSQDKLLLNLAVKNFTRDLRIVAVNDFPTSVGERVIRFLNSALLPTRFGTKVLQFPRQESRVESISEAVCNESVDDGVSVLGYQISRRNGEYFLGLRMLTNHVLAGDYLMVLHVEAVDGSSGTFVNLDFAPHPPTPEWRPQEPVTVVRQLICPPTLEWRPEKAVNIVHQLAFKPGEYVLRVGLWDLSKGLIGRLVSIGPVTLPDSVSG